VLDGIIVQNNPINANDPSGLEKQFSVSANGTFFVMGGGGSGGPGLGISLPDSMSIRDWRDVQFFAKTGATVLAGTGVYADIGVSGEFGWTSGPLPTNLTTNISLIAVAKAGMGSTYGGSVGVNVDNLSEFSWGDIPIPKTGHLGTGGGLIVAGGVQTSSSIASPTLGEMFDSTISGLNNLFSFGSTGSNQQSAQGGFVLYPNKPNTNMIHAVYSK
jgi:hypothetical protein